MVQYLLCLLTCHTLVDSCWCAIRTLVDACRCDRGLKKLRLYRTFYYVHSGSDATRKKCCNLHRFASDSLLFTQRQRRTAHSKESVAIYNRLAMGFCYLHSGSDKQRKKYCNLHRLASEILLFTQRQRQLTDRGGSKAIGLHRQFSFVKVSKKAAWERKLRKYMDAAGRSTTTSRFRRCIGFS